MTHQQATTMPRAIVIGAGFGGIGAAIKLAEAGVRDLVVVEKADRVGGTWRDNSYPGAACDIPAHLYSFSFAPKADWTTHYPRQAEIQAYLEQVVDDHGLRPHLRLGTAASEARFDDDRAIWLVQLDDGDVLEAEVLVAAIGPLSRPKLPDLAGVGLFAGTAMHTARWDHDVPLRGQRVGVVGTGASAVQVIPELAGVATPLTVFQRSAPWIVPKLDRNYSAIERWLFSAVPGVRWAWRQAIYWQKESRFVGFGRGSRAMRGAETVSRVMRWLSIRDPQLRAQLEPSYAMGCKRVVISNDYYRTLARDDVELVTTPIERVVPEGVLLHDGRVVELDVIVWGTGFDVVDGLGSIDFVGLAGRRLSELWDPHPVGHLGTTVPGFPNLFVILGPNTGLAHNSMIHVMESQYAYVVDAVRLLADPDVAWLVPTDEALQRFRAEVDRRNERMVWASGCRSWYLDADGHNFALWPGYTFELRRRLRRIEPAEVAIERWSARPAPVAA